MKVEKKKSLPLLFCALLFAGFVSSDALSYDYASNIECLTKPKKPQYGGGIIVNPELNEGLKGWSAFGAAKIYGRKVEDNSFAAAHTRNQPHDSISQKLYFKKNKLYVFSAWVQISEGSAPLTAVFKTNAGFKYAGSTVAQSKCWSMLKGGLTVEASGPAELYFESKNTSVEIWVDSISLQPFTQEQWRAHQDESIEKVRKRRVKVQAVDKQGNPLANATISIQQTQAGFPFGCAIDKNILNNAVYQNWFTSRFKVTTFVNEMKWYSTEYSQGHEDYSVADAMLWFAKQHNVAVRGHNIFWDDPQYQLSWVPALSTSQLLEAAEKRSHSVVRRYKGQVIAWDVENENLHFNFFESKLGQNASGMFYNWAMNDDGATTLFMNEYNTIEDKRDWSSSPANYLAKLKEIQSYPGNSNAKLAIGLESHFSLPPDIPYIRSTIDTLGAAGLPIWLTEVDVFRSDNQANYLEQVLREAYSHPKVNGIVMWTPPIICDRTCLTDNNFHNTPAGDVVDKLLHEWGFNRAITARTDANGFFEDSLFHGDYEVKITHPDLRDFSFAENLKVEPPVADRQTTLYFRVEA